MANIILLQMSDFDPSVLKVLKNAAEAAFKVSVEVRNAARSLAYAYDPIREQFDSPMLLARLKKVKRERGDKLLGVVDVDLFSTGFDYVYGEADVAEGIATLSLARLHPEFAGETPDREIFEERAVKEGVHELGHLFGLLHCRDKKCVMRFCPNPEYVDEKPRNICPRCSEKLSVKTSLPRRER
jgi:archaemetzincin